MTDYTYDGDDRMATGEAWKIVKNRLPFFGTAPFFLVSLGAIRTSASTGLGLIGGPLIIIAGTGVLLDV